MDTLEDDPLQVALAHAFEESPIIARSPSADASTSRSPAKPVENPVVDVPSSDDVEGNGNDESWKEDLERLSASWRVESAVAREKAERERERWRILREQEAAVTKAQKKPERKESEWEDVAGPLKIENSHTTLDESNTTQFSAAKGAAAAVNDVLPRQGSPSPADVRDLITSEVNRRQFLGEDSTLPQDNAICPQSNVDDQTLSGSRTWEDVPSLDSSFPSFSMHDHFPPGPGPGDRPQYQQPPEPPSVTLSIFDRSLTRRARTLAIISSIAINLLLPFINGVMLGFGEIFAKNIVGYFGWELPGTGLGIHTSLRRKRE